MTIPWLVASVLGLAIVVLAAFVYFLRAKSNGEPLLLLQQQIDALRRQTAESAQTQTEALSTV
jgi:hypothetical protein